MKKYFQSSAHILITLLITSFFIGLIVTLQWKAGILKTSLYPLDQIEAQKQLLQIFVEEQQTLEKEVSELRNELEMAKKSLPEPNEKEKTYREEQKRKIGFTEIIDDGVEIFLGDSPVAPEELVRAADLRDVINLLFSSGADAIAVNGRRVLPLHSIHVVGTSFLINDFYAFPPFSITATGQTEVLIGRLQDETFLSDLRRRSREKRLRFSYQSRRDLIIPSYKGSLRNQFISEPL